MADPPQGESGRFTARDLGLAAAMNVMWGLNLIAVKMGVDLLSPMAAAWLRQFMVLLICLPFLRFVEGRMREPLALGVLSGAIFYIVVNLSLAVSDNVAALAIAGQLGAPFALILAVLILKERVALYRVVGMGLSFFGVVLLVFDPSAAGETLGLALQALSALIWAFCSLIQRRLAGVPVLTIYAWVGLVGSTILLPVALISEPQTMWAIGNVPLATFGWVLFSALGSTVIGQGAMSVLLQRHPISAVVPLTLMAPVIAVVAGAWWFETPLTPLIVIGGLIVMAGVAIITVRTARAREGGQA
jgi:O-acetylserine/cysteine efflux transporter